MPQNTLPDLSDDELLRRLEALVRDSRRTEAELIAHIGEVDARRLYARKACPSMFAYCAERLHLSDAEAYFRITAARAARRHPLVLSMLADGRLHLTAVVKLAPHLTAENCEELLARAVHKTKREVEELVADWSPRPAAPAVVRKLPAPLEPKAVSPVSIPPSPRPDSVERSHEGPIAIERYVGGAARLDGSTSVAPAPVHTLRPTEIARWPNTFEPSGQSRYRVQFTASATLRQKLERLRALMRRSVPDGDLARVIEEAVTEKLERLEARRFGSTRKPRASARTAASGARHIPAAIRRAVRERDGDRCRFVDAAGRRCTARYDLEFHHRRPFGHGGAHSLDNVSLVCRAHNVHLAEVDYGPVRLKAAGARPTAAAPSSP
jgi:hypothetical protein